MRHIQKGVSALLNGLIRFFTLFKMKAFIALLFALAVIVSADEGACTSTVYGTVENGQYGYAACDVSMDGYRYALCTDGVFGEDNTSHCTARTVTIFSYGIEAISYKVGTAIPTVSLKTDGSFSAYAISPELPQGLSFSTSNGAISGTPGSASEETTYTITGTSTTPGADASETTITITVTAVTCAAFDSFPETASGSIATSTTGCPTGMTGTAKRTCNNGHFGDLDISSCTTNAPSNLYYSGNINVKRLEHAMITASISGQVTSYSINPSLPTGLSIDTTKGTIAGVPTVTAAQATYTVTATGPGGSTTQTVVIAVTEASCSGLASESGSSTTKNHNEQIQFTCPEEYTGTWSYTCHNGVYENKYDGLCWAKKPTGFSYSKPEYDVYLGETLNTGIPTISGIVIRYEANGLPEGFSIDPATGTITGSSDVAVTASVTVSAIANELMGTKASATVTIVVKDVTCDATEDFAQANNGGTSSFTCKTEDNYQEGKMTRKCKNDGKNNGVFELPTYYCQKNQDYTFFIICCGILAFCVIILLIGCCVKSSRTRSKNQKNLAKTNPKAPAAKPAAKPAAPKAAKKVTI